MSKLEALIRVFHTVKGFSEMVGARNAEQTAHGLEPLWAPFEPVSSRSTSEEWV